MEHDFWHQRWEQGRIGFHQGDINPYLKEHWSELALDKGSKVLVPLCGKSLDMLWLQEQGYAVLGCELSEAACRAFFAENMRVPELTQQDIGPVFSSDNITLLAADIFTLEAAHLADVAAVYDRAALIALPKTMRKDYAQLLIDRLPLGCQLLLVTLEFDADAGPPFSVPQREVEALFSGRFMVERLAEVALGGERGAGRVEVVYRLTEARSAI
ncbi:thiopurine S-methyltransferase [Neptunomonas marina]|uniref:Thiopurine S-methyltransferase n=1 Tax=Neptunomonas marina TaxID=1815562 RepID=A0A437Q5Q9_9GAMM|nr:thiopurine S-methyltransferase [Neptunomonas marina]RVU29847.1 thiopurine S-methyltransferase [Neptunomonas marina]